MLEHPALDEHEASATVADFDATRLICFLMLSANHVEDEGSGMRC